MVVDLTTANRDISQDQLLIVSTEAPGVSEMCGTYVDLKSNSKYI